MIVTILGLVALLLCGVALGWLLARSRDRQIIENEAMREFQDQKMPTPLWVGHINGLREAAARLGSTKYRGFRFDDRKLGFSPVVGESAELSRIAKANSEALGGN